VEVDSHRLQAREPRVTLVEVAPPSLREADGLVREDPDGSAEKVPRWHEIGIEDGDKRGIDERHPMRQSACFESRTRAAPDLGDIDALSPPMGSAPRDDGSRVVVRVVENLDFESITRPIEHADRIENAFCDVALVVDRHLDADARLVFRNEEVTLPRAEARGAPCEKEEIHTESEQSNARQHEHADGERCEHAQTGPSNNV
jgi:hypothetical protein